MKIMQANLSHLDPVAKLFNDYRIFYAGRTRVFHRGRSELVCGAPEVE